MDSHKENIRSLRDNLKPIGKAPEVISLDHKDFLEFEKDYKEKKRLLAEQRRKDREEYYAKIGLSNKHNLKMTSNKWEEINERDNELKKVNEMREKEVIERAKLRFSYGKDIKKNHWPEISQKKQRELIERKNRLESKSSRQREPKPLTSRISKSMIGTNLIENGSQGGSIPSNQTPLKRVRLLAQLYSINQAEEELLRIETKQ